MSKNRGFTLIEMMVVLAIFSIVIGIAYTALSLNETYRDLVLTKIQLYRQNKRAIDTITAELQRSAATHWTIIDGGGSSPDIIRFQTPLVNSMDAQYNIPWGARHGNTDYPNFFIQYKLSGTQLIREVVDGGGVIQAGTQRVIAENISNLQFTNLNPLDSDYIRITMESQRSTIQRRIINANLVSTVFLRN